LALLLLIYVVPVANILVLSFEAPNWTLRHYVHLLQDPAVLRVLASTIRLAIEVTLLCLLLGYPVAYLMLRASPFHRTLITALIILPVWISILVRAYAWIVVLGRRGLANSMLQFLHLTDAPIQLLYNRFAIDIALVHIFLPFIVLPIYGVMRRIDLDALKAARSLGASGLAAFVWIFVPLSLPGVMAGSLLVFIMTVGIFVIPALLGGLRDITFVMLIEKQLNEFLNWPAGAAMAGALLLVTLVFVLLYQRFFGGTHPVDGSSNASGAPWALRIFAAALALFTRITHFVFGPRSEAARARASWRLPAYVGDSVLAVYVWGALAFLLLPILILFPLAFSASPYLEFPPPGYSLRWFRVYFGRPDWIAPTITSFNVAFITMIIATPLGVLTALALARFSFRGKAIVEGFVLSPLMLPTMIIAVGLYLLLSPMKFVGTVTGLVLGHLVLATPFVVSTVAAALRATDDSLERAARSMGAGPFTAFRRVTLPLIMPAVLTGAFFAFLASFDDFVVALFMSGTAAKTLPKRIWEAIREEVDPTTAAVAALLVTISLVLLFLAELARAHGERRARAAAPM
jgi:putative spermidine/putrescine transport system permease protein